MSSVNEQLRVLIVRLGAMGDILHAMPAVTALREAHPHWFLGWAVEPRWQALLRNDKGETPLVDRMHLATAKSWSRSPLHPGTLQEIRAVRGELRAEGYDVCVDLQGAVRSALLGRLAGASRMIGEDRPREPAARWLFGERISTQGVHVIEQAVEVCQAIAGERLNAVLPLLPVDPAAESWADMLLEETAAGSVGADQSRSRLGSKALAGGALWSGCRQAKCGGLSGFGECGAGGTSDCGSKWWRRAAALRRRRNLPCNG